MKIETLLHQLKRKGFIGMIKNPGILTMVGPTHTVLDGFFRPHPAGRELLLSVHLIAIGTQVRWTLTNYKVEGNTLGKLQTAPCLDDLFTELRELERTHAKLLESESALLEFNVFRKAQKVGELSCVMDLRLERLSAISCNELLRAALSRRKIPVEHNSPCSCL